MLLGHFYIGKGADLCSVILLPASIYSQAKVGYYNGNPMGVFVIIQAVSV